MIHDLTTQEGRNAYSQAMAEQVERYTGKSLNIEEETAKEVALITSYIIKAELLNDTFFHNFDKAYSLAKEFIQFYPPHTNWEDLEKDWDEVLEDFVNNKIE